MSDQDMYKDELSKLMRDGWSYRSSSVGVHSSDILVDPSTGKRYKLAVIGGKLTMAEVTE